jgi:hypothetical protein
MPSTQPAALSAQDLSELQDQLNYIVKDIYAMLDEIKGVDNKTFEPGSIGDHSHTSSDTGGDYAWADFVQQDVTYLQALVADITESNLVDKSAAESITGLWDFTQAAVSGFNGSVAEVSTDATYTADDEDFVVLVDCSATTNSASLTPTASGHDMDCGVTYNWFDNSDDNIYFGYAWGVSSKSRGGILFPNSIPAGAVITSAHITFTGWENRSLSISADLRLYFSDEDTASAPADRTTLNGKTPTTAYTDWTPPSTWMAGNTENTPSIVTSLQEVMDRPGRNTSDPVLLLVDSNVSSSSSQYVKVRSHDYGSAASYPTLEVSWNTGSRTINLPTASGRQGKAYVIKKTDSSSGEVVIDPNGAETIDGAASMSLYKQYDSVIIYSDGTNWKVGARRFGDMADRITGTTNQVTVTDNSDSTVTLSLPQSIDTDADVEFDSATLDDLTASTLVQADANKKLISHTEDSHIADASTSHTITDPGDAPADADALRDDLVANTIPDIESKLNSLGTTVNSILTALENANIVATS